MKRLIIVSVAIVVITALGLVWYRQDADTSNAGQTAQPGQEANDTVQTVAQDLEIPWDVAILPDGDMLVTERPGTLRRIGQNEQTHQISGVEHIGEGGLLGVALHPNFSENNWVYLYFTTREDGNLSNKIVRYELGSNSLNNRTDILTGVPAASNHNGGRIAFGPDGYLYVGTGDAANTALSQNTDSLAGKILRLRDDGRPAPNNPFDNAIYSYGHRNVQGLTWDEENRLWATEHGPNAHDELNLITAGANYGWPVIRGDETRDGMETPVRHSGSNETWAPSGLAFADGSFFFGGLRGQTLYEAPFGRNSGVAELKAHFEEEYGRIRAVVAHDGALYITTSNTDGRGSPASNDDRLIRIPLNLLQK